MTADGADDVDVSGIGDDGEPQDLWSEAVVYADAGTATRTWSFDDDHTISTLVFGSPLGTTFGYLHRIVLP